MKSIAPALGSQWRVVQSGDCVRSFDGAIAEALKACIYGLILVIYELVARGVI